MSYYKQHELGIAGLALLRNWLVGDEQTAKLIIREIEKVAKEINNKSNLVQTKVNSLDVFEGYKVWADTYDSVPNLLLEVEEPTIRNILKRFTPGEALDAACGTGRLSELLNSVGYKVTGIDQSPSMLSQARKIRNKNIDFIEGNLTSIPLRDKSVDLAICGLALTHLLSLDKAVSELKRVLRPGGHIIISDTHPWLVMLGGQADFIDKTGNYDYVLNHIHWHSDYFKTFQKLQLKVIECLEPKMELKHVKLAAKGFSLKEKTVSTALVGLPIALVWVLELQ